MDIIRFNNSKIGRFVGSIDFPRVLSCRPDAPCLEGCYMKKLYALRKVVRSAHEKNLDLWNNDNETFKGIVRLQIKTEGIRLLRICSDGDIPDKEFLEFLFSLAEEFPQTNILLFTKKYEIVNSALDTMDKPANLSIVLSAWGTWLPENPHNLPVAYVELRNGNGADLIPDDAYECSGGCASCEDQYHCWFMQNGDSVKFHQH